MENPFLVHNKNEWLRHPSFKWTEEEIDNADEKGFIGTKYGVDCYLTRPLPTELHSVSHEPDTTGIEEIPKFRIGGKALAKGEVVVTYRDHLKQLQKAREEERERCRRLFVEQVDWAEWGMDDKDASERFDEALTTALGVNDTNI